MTTTPRQPRIRVAAIIVDEDHILMVRHQKGESSYWMLPGGGVDYGETLPEALARELREELCVEIEVGDLRFVNDSVAPDGSRHIVNMHFDAEILDEIPRLGEDERIVEVAYHPISALPTLPIRPAYGPRLTNLLQEWTVETDAYWGTLWKED